MAKTGLTGGAGQTPPIFANPGSVFRRGEGGILPERGSRAQYDTVQALLQSGLASSQQSGSPLLAFLAPMLGGAVGARAEGLYKDAQGKRDQNAIDQLLEAMGTGGTGANMAGGGQPQDARRSSLIDQMFPVGKEGAAPVGNVDPATGLNMGTEVDDGIVASMSMIKDFEGYRSKPYWDVNAHRVGYGSDTITNPDGTVRKVSKGDTVTQEMADLDLQRRVSQEFMPAARDAVGGEAFDRLAPEQKAALTSITYNYGSLPKSVASAARSGDLRATAQAIEALGSHNDGINAGRRSKEAQAFLGAVSSGDFSTYANMGQQGGMSQDNMRDLIGLMTNQDVSPEIRNLASTMLGQGMQRGQPLSPQDQIGMATDMLGLETAMTAAQNPTGFRAATPEEAAAYGAQAGQFGPDGRFYPATSPNTATAEAGMMRQRNEATTSITEAVSEMEMQGLSRDEALARLAKNPIYRHQLEALGIDPADLIRAQEVKRAESDREAAQKPPGLWDRLFGGGDSAAQNPPPVENDPLGIR